MFKTAENFGGYWLKGVKTYKGHEGEPLFQGNIYLNNRKIGFFAMGDWGGLAALRELSEADAKVLRRFSSRTMNSDFEPETGFFCSIMAAIETRQYYLRRCRTKTLVKLQEYKEGEYITFAVKYKDDPYKVKKYLNHRYGRGKYILINEELNK